MEKTLAIIIGVQGSGKSTFYKTQLEKDYVRINLDTLKTRDKECELVKECFEKGYSLAIDNTNPTRFDRSRYITLAIVNDYRIIAYYMNIRFDECVRRNNQRKGKERIPIEAIRRTALKLKKPSYDEGFDEIYIVTSSGKGYKIKEV